MKDLLKFSTAGSVDDGKSTLIGRLLYETQSIYEDQLDAITKASEKRNEDFLNLALLTDGLRSEREQGITIDVAYRYFSTPRRKFILSDSPGHVQYTRNMVTAVSGSSLVIIIIDARNGVQEQTRRHAFISELLGIKHLLVCVNKMDLVDFSEDAYEAICGDFKSFLSKTSIPDVHFLPVSALQGDNVFKKSDRMPWYQGPSLIYLLENTQVNSDYDLVNCRFPVQMVLRPQSYSHPDYRGYAGRVAGGVFKEGDQVMVLPSGYTSRIKSIDTYNGGISEAFPPLSVSFQLEDDIDISRGDMLVKPNNQPRVSQDLDLLICWLGEKPLLPGSKLLIRHTTREVKCVVREILYKVNINTLHREENDLHIGLNDIGRISVRTSEPLIFDSFGTNKVTGSLILIDELSNATVAAGIIR